MNNENKFKTHYFSGAGDPNEYFKNHHHWESFQDDKKYEYENYTHDYGYGNLEYTNTLYSLDGSKYVVVEEVFTKEMFQKYAPYCQCIKCQASWWEFSKKSMCACCVGCLKYGDRESADVIAKTREYMRSKGIEY